MNLHEHMQHLRQLDDDGLLRSLKRHVASSNRLNALVLAHLAEVDARGAYRHWACETLAAYCVYELRLSEDEAQRRCRAARVARQFPVLLELLAEGSIHLTAILMLAPYLTAENHVELIARARYRRKREIERLVAELTPAVDVPALVEPLGAATRNAAPARPRNTWAAHVEGNAGWYRELKIGDGPARAPNATDEWHEALMAQLDREGDALERSAGAGVQSESADDGVQRGSSSAGQAGMPSVSDARGAAPARNEQIMSAGCGGAPPLGAGAPRLPLRYKVQFTADQSYVDLLDRARDLLWHQMPTADLVELQRLALEALVEKLMHRKCGGAARPDAAAAHAEATDSDVAAPARKQRRADTAVPSTVVTTNDDSAAPARTSTFGAEPDASTQRRAARRDSRHIPAAVRRGVWQRDEGRCTFVDTRGVRCRATRGIEFHHVLPFARGGPHCTENVTLRCRAHNELAAERDFGRDFARRMKHERDAM